MATISNSYRCLVTSRPIFTRHVSTSSISCSLRNRRSIPRQNHATFATQTQTQAQVQQTVTHNNKKAAHGHACEADWDYLAYSEPEARLFLSRAISILFVLIVNAVTAFDCPESRRSDQTTTMYDTTIHHCPPKTKGRHRGHGRSHHGRTRG